MHLAFREETQPYAVVIGLDDLRGVYVARTLARYGIPILGIAKDPKSYGVRTRYCKRIQYTDTANEELLTALTTLASTLDRKAVLFPCTDRSVQLISRHRRQLEQWYQMALPEPDIVEMLLDKLAFYAYAQSNDFPIPRTCFVKNPSDIGQAINDLTPPYALKPPSSKAPRWLQQTHIKAFKAENASELRALYERCCNWADTLIVQEWIEGPEANLYSCNCYFDANSKPVAAFVSRKLRQWPPQTGDTCLGEECRNDIVLQESIRLFESVQFRGLGYIEMKRDERSGKYFIVEPNIGRPTARSGLAEVLGIEMLYGMYCDALGWQLPERLEQKFYGVKWINLRRDMQSSLHYWRNGELTMKEWWASWQGRKAYALFSWKDPAPFLGDIVRGLRLLLSPLERGKRSFVKTLPSK